MIAEASTNSRPSTHSRSEFRPEIQALRALAVTLVVTFHFWPQQLTGGYVGVDIFFVISGYLITSHLLREKQRTGRIVLSQFYARRVRRLLPAALFVLAVTLVTVVIVVPTSLWKQFLGEIAASALYFVNWLLAINSVDYFGAENLASPVQHYWSLSVEEQFYIVWPLLIIGVFALTRSAEWRTSLRWLTAVFAAVFAAGLVYSVVGSRVAQAPTYFATPAHAWEFAAGGLLAIVGLLGAAAQRVDFVSRLPRYARSLASWLGFAVIVFSAVRFDGESLFPGYIALIPVIATVVVIAMRVPDGRFSPGWIVSNRAVQWLGSISYSVYLWHWPLIVLTPFVIGSDLTLATKLLLIAATIVLGALTKRFVEDSVRISPLWSPRLRTYTAAAMASFLIVGASFVPTAVAESRADDVRAYVDSQVEANNQCFGAAALPSGASCEYETTIDPKVGDDPSLYAAQGAPDGCPLVYDDIVRECVTGDDDAELSIAFIGDSHMRHYGSAVFPLLENHDWQYRFIVRGACPAVSLSWSPSTPDATETNAGCVSWRESMQRYVSDEIDVDLIVVSNYTAKYSFVETAENRAQMAQAYATTWKNWTDQGTPVLVIGDAPVTQQKDVPTCVHEHLDDLDECSMPVDDAIGNDPLLMAARDYPNPLVSALDHTDAFCDDSRCYVVAGGVVAYADKHHIAPAFARSLAPRIEAAITAALATGAK